MLSRFQARLYQHSVFTNMNNRLIKRLFLCASLVLVSSLSAAQDEFTVLFLGDSLTEGYGLDDGESFPSLIENMLDNDGMDHIKVINAGISGSTSASGLSRLQWYIRSRPDLMVLSLGANDGLRGLSIDEMKANLSRTIEFAQTNGVATIITGMLVPPNMGPEYAEAFARVFPDLAADYNLPLMPFLLQDVAAVPELNQSDGIHPNVAGTQIVAKNLYDFLQAYLPQN